MIMQSKLTTNISQNQQLLMSDQLQQAIKLLQLSTTELNAVILEELEKNPLLSVAEKAKMILWLVIICVMIKLLTIIAVIILIIKPALKLFREHVMEQLSIDITNQYQKIIALNLLDLLDENGYIDPDFTSLAKILHVKVKDIEQVLAIMQKFSPSGIFARNLAECLKLQLQEQQKFDQNYQFLLDNLPLIAKGGIADLLKIAKITKLELQQMMQTIKKLNPKPGNIFSSPITNYVLPEIYVYLSQDKLIVELNNEILPKVLLNKKYYTSIRLKTKDNQARQYLSTQLQNANWLIKALDKRANSLLKVATAIVEAQQEFFFKGVNYLKPMTIKEIAQVTGLHESSVSRITTNKFMSTSLGLFEMKFFFSSKIEAENFSEDYSSRSVKNLIRELISKETKPLSDQELSLLLKERNIHIARRTVTKYRESLQIPVTKLRKQRFMLNS